MVAGAALADFRAGGGGGGGGGGTRTNDGCGRAPTALVIGLGGGALPNALRRIYSGVRVLAVELDSEVVDVAKEHFGLNESASLKVCGAFISFRLISFRFVSFVLHVAFLRYHSSWWTEGWAEGGGGCGGFELLCR